MRFLDEHRRRPALLADHLPWAAMVAPGVVLNKDGSFTCGLRFRGPDLESASDLELMSVRARLNNALKRLGSGWCLHVEARRRPAQPYPASDFEIAAAWLVDAERRSLFETSEPAYETDYRAALTWLPPADQTRRMERVLFDGADPASRDWRTALDAFARETAQIVDLLADALPEVAMLDDAKLLTWLHDCVSPRSVRLALPATPMFLDAWLADAPLLGGVAPTLDGRTLKVVSVRGLPSSTRPGLLDALGALPFPYRWSARWIGLDKADAEVELVKLRKRWFAKRKGVGVLLREAITKEEVPLLDTDAAAKTDECDGALEALGSDACAYGYPDDLSLPDLTALGADRSTTARRTAEDLARTAAELERLAQSRDGRLRGAMAASEAAEGETAAIQSSTQMLSVLAEDLASMRTLLLAQSRLMAEGAARQAADREAAIEARRRFWERGTATPAAPSFNPLPHARD